MALFKTFESDISSKQMETFKIKTSRTSQTKVDRKQGVAHPIVITGTDMFGLGFGYFCFTFVLQ